MTVSYCRHRCGLLTNNRVNPISTNRLIHNRFESAGYETADSGIVSSTHRYPAAPRASLSLSANLLPPYPSQDIELSGDEQSWGSALIATRPAPRRGRTRARSPESGRTTVSGAAARPELLPQTIVRRSLELTATQGKTRSGCRATFQGTPEHKARYRVRAIAFGGLS
jgi:hypothetical protein